MISFEHVSKTYASSNGGVHSLDFEIKQGEFVYIIGSSGAGKSTIINLLIKNIEPNSGNIRLSHINLKNILPEDMPLYRRNFGIISPGVGMMMDQSVYDNVALPLIIRGEKKKLIRAKVEAMLGSVGIKDIAHKKAKHISGGELARVAIARALISDPPVILADEPTAGLDNDTAWDIMSLLEHFSQRGTTILIATHQKSLVNLTRKRVIWLRSGKIVSDEKGGRYRSVY